MSLVIDYGGAVPDDPKAINIPVQVQYQNITSGSMPLRGSTPSQDLGLMADAGLPSPLVGSFVGPSTVLNDGTTQHSLTLRLVNTSKDPLMFIVPSTGDPTQSFIEVALPVSDTAADASWALCGTSSAKSITPSLSGSAATGWSVTASKATSGLFELRPDYTKVQNIPPGGTLDLDLAGVTSALEPGIVQTQVSLRRFAVVGTQTFGVALEKSPLVYNSGPGTGMTLSAGILGANHALAVSGDTSAELVHINQSGTGPALLLDGGNAVMNKGATVTGGLTTDTATASGALTAQGGATVTGGLTADTAKVSGALTAYGTFNVDAPGTVGGRFTVLDTSGNVGIGTETPSQRLVVNGGYLHLTGGLTGYPSVTQKIFKGPISPGIRMGEADVQTLLIIKVQERVDLNFITGKINLTPKNL